MCGRYYVDEIVEKEIRQLVQVLGAKGQSNDQEFAAELLAGYQVPFQKVPDARDVHPSEWADIICLNQGKVQIRTMRWGFPGKNAGLIINARAETVLERPLFRESACCRRCVVPAGRYYEWNSLKEKVTFARKETPVLYMAGLYNLYQEEERFVVITTEANKSVQAVHDRMPLIFERHEVESWLRDEAAAQRLLQKVPGALQRTQEYEQMSLWSMVN